MADEIEGKSPASSLPQKSRAKIMQQKAEKPSKNDPMINITVILDNGYKEHLSLPESVVLGILDPDVPDAFLEVKVQPPPGGVPHPQDRRFIHTSRFREVLTHNEIRRAMGG